MPTDALSYVPPGPEFDQIRGILTILKRDFPDKYATLSSSRVQGWVSEIESGTGRDDNQLRDDIAKYVLTAEDIMNRYGVDEATALNLIKGANDGGMNFSDLSDDQLNYENVNPDLEEGAPPEEDTAEAGVGTPGEDGLTILTSKDMKWYFDKSSGQWYVSYKMPNSQRELIFEADPDDMDALFGENMRPTNYENTTFANLTAREGVTFGGNVAQMEGTGSFEDEFDKVIAIALDEGELPEWMKNSKKALDALFIAQTENKSNEWLMEQWSKLPEFQARFPNIEQIKKEGNMTLAEAVTSFLEYEAGLNQAVAAFGLDEDVVTPEVIGGLIDGGYSLKTVQDVIKAYDRMEEYAPAMEAFNQILEANGMEPISDLQSMFDFVNGSAPDDYYDLYEASSLQEAASKAGLDDIFSAQDAIDAALAGTYDLESANAAMQNAAKLALRLRGEIALDQYDITTEELIDLSLGVIPDSGKTQAEMQETINRITLSAKANLQGRAKPFTGFTPSGTPQQRSLSGLRQQS